MIVDYSPAFIDKMIAHIGNRKLASLEITKYGKDKAFIEYSVIANYTETERKAIAKNYEDSMKKRTDVIEVLKKFREACDNDKVIVFKFSYNATAKDGNGIKYKLQQLFDENSKPEVKKEDDRPSYIKSIEVLEQAIVEMGYSNTEVPAFKKEDGKRVKYTPLTLGDLLEIIKSTMNI